MSTPVTLPRTFPELLAARLQHDPGQPLLTAYDDTSGERTELSVTTYANWVSKTGNLFVDELGLDAGDTVLLDLPAHWLVPVFLGAAWSSALAVTTDPDLHHDLVVCGPDAVGRHRGEVVACALLPFAVRFSRPAAGRRARLRRAVARAERRVRPAGPADARHPRVDPLRAAPGPMPSCSRQPRPPATSPGSGCSPTCTRPVTTGCPRSSAHSSAVARWCCCATRRNRHGPLVRRTSGPQPWFVRVSRRASSRRTPRPGSGAPGSPSTCRAAATGCRCRRGRRGRPHRRRRRRPAR